MNSDHLDIGLIGSYDCSNDEKSSLYTCISVLGENWCIIKTRVPCILMFTDVCDAYTHYIV